MITFKTLSLTALAFSAVSVNVVARPAAKIELRLQTTNLDPASKSLSSTPLTPLTGVKDPFNLVANIPTSKQSPDQITVAGPTTTANIEKRLAKRCLKSKRTSRKNYHKKHHKKHSRHHKSKAHHKSTGHWQAGQGTYYDAGLGACGETNSGTDLIAAISKDVYDQYTVNGNPNNNALCNQYVEAKYGSHTVKVKIVDRCVGCAAGSLDFSRSAFSKLAPQSLGRINIRSKWLTGPLA